MKTGLGSVLVLGLLVYATAYGDGERPRSVDRFDTVVIDAGHGGEDEGAEGPRGTLEKTVVLDVALQLAKALRAHDLRVVTTRTSDVFVPLEERFAIANDARGDLFLSIHANAARDIRVRGVETYFLSLEASDEEARRLAERENESFSKAAALLASSDPFFALMADMAFGDYHADSNEFASFAQARLARAEGVPSRGVKQAPFVVLQGVQMPASLVEIGFITNPDDAKRLRSAEGRSEVAQALAQAVLEFAPRYDKRRGVEGGVPASGH